MIDPATSKLREGRQGAPKMEDINASHRARYKYAADYLAGRLPAGSLVLDVGCGVGYGSRLLAQSGFKVIGMDISNVAIGFAYTHYWDPGVTFEIVDVVAAELPKADAVVALEIIEHIEDDRSLVASIGKSTRLLVASAPNVRYYPYEGSVTQHHYRHYERARFENLLSFGGFNKIVESSSVDDHEQYVRKGEKRGRFMVYIAERDG